MKQISLFISLLFSVSFVQAQSLSATITVVSKTYCRVHGFQSGNGMLSASISGGSGNHYLNWTGPAGSSNLPNTPNIIARMPGFYTLEVIDTITPDYFIDSVYVDSINPVPDFTVVSPDLIGLGNDEYLGYNTANVSFDNNSQGFVQPSNPNSDTLFQWNFDTNTPGGWFFTFDTSSVNNTYGVGVYEVALIARNYNDCSDTAFATISIYATSASISEVGADKYMVIPNNNSKYIDVIQGVNSNVTLKVFNIQGQLIIENELNNLQNLIPFDYPVGVYVYQISKHSKVIFSDKFQF
ncbi:MAG: T9SS type A sorting domain-containing protein [Crocinitomicaceae bacterium]